MVLPADQQSGKPIFADWLNRLKRAVFTSVKGDGLITVTQSGQNLTIGFAGKIPGISPPILAKITEVDVANEEFGLVEVLPDGSEPDNPRTWDGGSSPNLPKAHNLYGVPVGPVDGVVQLHRGVDPSDPSTPYWWFEGVKPWETFAVDLSQTGGSAGDASSEASFTYTVNDLDGNELGTSVSPEHARPSLGALVAATKGMAYYTAGAELKLLWTDEQPDMAECE